MATKTVEEQLAEIRDARIASVEANALLAVQIARRVTVDPNGYYKDEQVVALLPKLFKALELIAGR